MITYLLLANFQTFLEQLLFTSEKLSSTLSKIEKANKMCRKKRNAKIKRNGTSSHTYL